MPLLAARTDGEMDSKKQKKKKRKNVQQQKTRHTSRTNIDMDKHVDCKMHAESATMREHAGP